MELLRRLNDSFSASGYEDEIRTVVCEYLSQWYDISVDVLGNVVASKKGVGETIVFAAPMDTGGVFLNCRKEENSYYYVKISSEAKTDPKDAKGRTFDGATGMFVQNRDHPEYSHFVSNGGSIALPSIADILVPFSASEKRVTSRQAALYALLLLAEKVHMLPFSFTFVALAQTMLRQRGAFGRLPQDAAFCVVLEPLEAGRYQPGDGAVLCLKDGVYLCPEQVRMKFSTFKKYYVSEEKPSLSAALAKQGRGHLVASVKIPVRGIGTKDETFCPSDIHDLCHRLFGLVEKGLTKS